jgi:outer membrane protein OmpA-like peptidoglycan-associated protein
LFDYEIKQRASELKDDIRCFVSDSVGSANRNIQLKHVFYKTGSADLSDLSAYELDNVVGLLNQYPSLKVELGGHTDNVGAEDSNLELSQKRADNVREYLLSKGIDAGRISAKGYGQNLPVESNDTDEGKQKNRRTELRILSK